MNWLLPEYIADALPAESAKIEVLRRRLLDLFQQHGYELVTPPLLEYLDSLLTGTAQDLEIKTFKLADQASGRTLGVRADTTPQVARIDAHLLNRQGVARLCYCGSVLHTLPACMVASREPLQIGAELYGYSGIEADIAVVRLLASTLETCQLQGSRIDLGHVGIFQALTEAAGLDAKREDLLLTLMQAKDVPGLTEVCADIDPPYAAALLALPTLYGNADVLTHAARLLPPLPAISVALEGLSRIVSAVPDLPLSIDLADLRGYHYHNGVVFAAYHPGYPAAIARGGRYDGAGKAFGRVRPATGFSLDLREVASLSPITIPARAIVAPPALGDETLSSEISRLRTAGEIVIELLPGEKQPEGPVCERQLRQAGGNWIIEAINTD